MKKYLTRREIMDLICLTSYQFDKCISTLNIDATILFNIKLFTLENLISIYNFIYNNKENYIVLDSKINYKEMSL